MITEWEVGDEDLLAFIDRVKGLFNVEVTAEGVVKGTEKAVEGLKREALAAKE